MIVRAAEQTTASVPGTILISAGMSAGSALLFRPTLSIQSSLHRSCRLEFQPLGGRDLDGLTCLRIATLPGPTFRHAKLAEAENRDFLAVLGRVSYGSEHAVDQAPCEALRQIVFVHQGVIRSFLFMMSSGRARLR